MASIRQNPQADALPDFRNLGVTARSLIAVNLLALAYALLAARGWEQALELFVRTAVPLEPLLVASLVALYAAAPWLLRLDFWAGCSAVIALVIALAIPVYALFGVSTDAGLARTLAVAAATAAVVLGYLRLHMKAYSPALAEARLQALQARIRPHFLFNSLNAVLSLIRRDPVRAEHTLQDLAELFRALMSDARSLVRLADEIAMLERYAAIEQLRLGERLRLSWELDGAPVAALLPPLVLQPLLENAIYHGVEHSTGASDVLVRIERRGERVLARIESPYRGGETPGDGKGRAGNRMAMDNIRERLMLFFDDEARLDSRVEGTRFVVELDIPLRSGAA